MQYLQNMINLAKSLEFNFTAHSYSTFVKNKVVFGINAVNIASGIMFALCCKCLFYGNLYNCARSSIG